MNDGIATNRPREDQDIRIARTLARAGVPIFLAHPDPHQITGYVLPLGWQHTVADQGVLDGWKPGMAVCAVMGHLCDGLDIDPRNGGEETRSGLKRAGPVRACGDGLRIRPLGDRVLQDVAWRIADTLGWSETFDAEYVALTQLQADALITLDGQLTDAVKDLVMVAPIGALS